MPPFASEDSARENGPGVGAIKEKGDFRVALVCVHGTHWMASRYVHALVRSHGYDTHTMFFRETFEQVLVAKRSELELCVQSIIELEPDVIGFNVTSMGYRE